MFIAFVYIRTVDIFEQVRADNLTFSEEGFKRIRHVTHHKICYSSITQFLKLDQRRVFVTTIQDHVPHAIYTRKEKSSKRRAIYQISVSDMRVNAWVLWGLGVIPTKMDELWICWVLARTFPAGQNPYLPTPTWWHSPKKMSALYWNN